MKLVDEIYVMFHETVYHHDLSCAHSPMHASGISSFTNCIVVPVKQTVTIAVDLKSPYL